MRFYKGDIVEVLQGDNIGQRYRLIDVYVSFWDGNTIILNTGIIADRYGELRYNTHNVMLYHRPFVNHIRDIFNRFSALFYKTKNNK